MSPTHTSNVSASLRLGALIIGLLFASATHAGGLANGGSVSGLISGPADVDTYTFSADAGDAVFVRLADTSAFLFYPELFVTAPGGALVDSVTGSDVSTVASIEFVAPASGTYTVTLRDDNGFGADNGSYRLYFTGVPGVSPNGPLVNSGSISGDIELGDFDAYTFDAVAGDDLIVRTADTSDFPMYPWLFVYDPDGILVGEVTGSDVDIVNTVFLRAQKTGTYIVVIADDNSFGALTGSYDIHFVRVPGAAENGPLINGDNVSGSIDIGDLDSWTFDGTAGDTVIIRSADVGTSPMYPILRLYDPDGQLIGSVEDSDVDILNTIIATLDQTGTHTLVIADDDAFGARTGNYDIYFLVTPGPNADGPLINDGSVAGVIGLGDLDAYTFDAQAGESVVIRSADLTTPSFFPLLLLYGPDGNLVADVSGGAVDVLNSIYYDVTQSGEHTLVIADDDGFGTRTGSYDIYFAKVPGANEFGRLDAGGGYADSIPLGDLDSFTIFAALGESVRIDLFDASDAPFYPQLLVYAPDNAFLTGITGGSVDVETFVEFNAIQSGIYTVVISDDDGFGARTGTYSVQTEQPIDLCMGSPDADGDTVPDACDNCTGVPNPDQRDGDVDGIGNLCDADFNNDCITNVLDLGILRLNFFSDDPVADMNGDGVVNVVDLGLLRQRFFTVPGPSGLGACAAL